MINIIKIYSSVWSKTIDYTNLFDSGKLSNKEIIISMIWKILYSLPLIPYVIFLINPFPTHNEFGEHTLLAVGGAMLVMSISGVLFSSAIIRISSERISFISSEDYKEHPFVATLVFYALGILFIFVFTEYLAPLLINAILIIREIFYSWILT
ncbi:hypothetical protein AB8633_003848 [Salmonella enterica]|nr:hypothetical protein [Salmonella enterica subsp. enterica serovar Java]ECC9066985.1 hypothetical protein [Salmonella enterica subsp. diarizonae]ECY5112796.1 hypothetical protein [Salmonella enterica subsp. enterica serovar Typhimurium]ECZ9369387.1 hypothetical protein [Salmonella enterica subsp. enterica serovar Enteritidis]EDQ4604253.1 hypothetical protein [Salmonella enterica subsp. arizonae]EDZ4088059.1 hypothetical protein [Salmonella enterica]EHE8613037.1 hypothetical protein [Salmone